MTHRYTRKLVWAGMCALLAVSFPVGLQAQVQYCSERMNRFSDGRLQHAIDELKSRNSSLKFQPDERPCVHAKETIASLSRTLGTNYLTRLSGYEFIKIINGESYFTVERFTTRELSDISKLAAALNRRNPRKLAIEANTRYHVYVRGENLLLMISSESGHDANSRLFYEIQGNF